MSALCTFYTLHRLSFCTVLRNFQFNLAHLRHHHFTLLEAALRETGVLVTTSAIFEDKKKMKKKRRQYSWQLATTVLLLSSPSDISEMPKVPLEVGFSFRPFAACVAQTKPRAHTVCCHTNSSRYFLCLFPSNTVTGKYRYHRNRSSKHIINFVFLVS